MKPHTQLEASAIEALLKRVLGDSVPVTFERTAQGVSTLVYRVFRGREVFYLRIAESPDDNLETEAELHRRLRSLGVSVAEIVYVDARNPGIGCSVMITTEVRGVALTEISASAVAQSVIERAGEQLALINRLSVVGFGFVRRCGRHWPMTAPHADYASFVVSHLPQPWPGPLSMLFSTAELGALEAMIDRECKRSDVRAALAHGDFDPSAVFCADGRYSGIIDFGEIRGAECLFDLGHFRLQDDEPPGALLPSLLRGYARVQTLPVDHEAAIRRSAVLLGLRQLCRWLGRPRERELTDPAVTRRARRIRALLDLSCHGANK